VRNYGRFLRESIPSILGQSERNLRLIAVDYGSTDDTPSILSGYAREDHRVEVVTAPAVTLVEALNIGMARATAPFIARQDADDISFSTRFALQLSTFRDGPEVVAVSGSCLHIAADGRETGSRYIPPDPELADCTSLPATEPYLLQPFLMVRRSAFEAVGGYRAGFVSFAEDTDLYWRLARRGRLVNLAEPLGLMRLHDGSISNASIVNGRILAIYSQLAAISRQRADLGQTDIDLDPAMLPALKDAGSIAHMLDIACRVVEGGEKDHLRVASSVKLLELSNSRAFELELADCAYIAAIYAGMPNAALGTRGLANWAYRRTLIRLARHGEHAKVRALARLRTLGRITMLRLFPAA